MTSVVRMVALATVTLAMGSWLGLGRPSLGQLRSMPELREIERRLEAGPPRPPSSPSSAGPLTPTGQAPFAAPRDPSDLAPPPTAESPSFEPWPTLNPEASTSHAWLVAEGPQRRPSDGRRLVTLTFDDGPFPETTPSVLRLLARHDVKATFFVIGRYLDGTSIRAERTRETLRQIAARGHLIGNHTHDHARLSNVTHTQVLEQIDRGAASIERVTGRRPLLFRPPFGELDDFGERAVADRNLELLLWSVEASDMQRADSHQMFRDLVGQLSYKEGGIVLLHDVRWTSVHALDELLAWLALHRYDPSRPSRVGYEIVDLPTYLREVAAAPLPYASRDELESTRRENRQREHPPRDTTTPVRRAREKRRVPRS